MKDLVKSSVAVTSIRAVGIVLQALILLFLARELPIEDMGRFAVLYAVFGLMRLLGPIGTDQISMRQIAQYRVSPAQVKVQRISNASFLLLLLCNVPLISAFVLMAGLFSAMFGLAWLEIIASAVTMLAFSLMGLFTGQIRGFGRNLLAQLPDSILLHIFFALGLAWAYVVDVVTLESSLIYLGVASIFTIFVYGVIRFRLGVDLTIRPRRHHVIKLAREGAQILQALFFTALSFRAPLFLAAIFMGPAASAVLEIATRFGTVATIITGSVGTTFSPRFAILIQQDKRAELSSTLSVGSVLAGVPAVLYAVAVAIFAPFLIEIILPQAYVAAYLPMVLICVAAVVNALFGLISNLLLMSGYSSVVRNFSAAQLAFISIFCAVLFDSFGVAGFAIAVILGAFVRDVGMAVWLRCHHQIKLSPFRYRKY